MTTSTTAPSYTGVRFPQESIAHAVWLYVRFSLSFRDVEEIVAERGVTGTYATIRQWCLHVGQTSANQLRRRHVRLGDTWHLDEVVITMNGKTQYLWRAVDQHGNVLDMLVQRHRKNCAAQQFFRTLLQGLHYVRRCSSPTTWAGTRQRKKTACQVSSIANIAA